MPDTPADEQASITILGREYAIERKPDKDERIVYWLTGARGAHYFTMRNQAHPECMFLGNARRFGIALDGVWLTDRNGVLEVL